MALNYKLRNFGNQPHLVKREVKIRSSNLYKQLWIQLMLNPETHKESVCISYATDVRRDINNPKWEQQRFHPVLESLEDCKQVAEALLKLATEHNLL